MKQDILSYLPETFPWQSTLHWFQSIDSTNSHAKELAAQGAPHGTVLIAGHQTCGRGRLGRSFHSSQGKGIYLSVILRPGCSASKLMHMTCAAAVATCDALEDSTGYRPGIKWINDLVVNGKKLGGILTELSLNPKSGSVDHAVIGIGINCNHEITDFPAELQDIATSVAIVTGQPCNMAKLAAALILRLYELCQILTESQKELMSQYREDCITCGKRIVALRADEKRYGLAETISDDGSLTVLFDDGTRESISSGEISIRGMYGYA